MIEIEGRVFSGSGKAAEFLSIDDYSDFLGEKLGEKPFPGTLNLRVAPGKLEELKQVLESSRLEPFEKDGREFGGITAYPVEVEGVEAVLLEIDKTHYGEDVAEIAASRDLREHLDLEDGDRVTVVSGSF